MTHLTNVQMTLDCADPHAQARFWAQALGWVVERNSAMIRSLLDQGVATADQVVEIDGELAWCTVEAIRHPEHDAIRELGGTARLLLQVVEEPKTVKNRMHLDVNVGREQIDAEVARLTKLGARELWRVDEPGAFHATMADPEGNEFCVQ
jgi:predicted enzyme related to lactoylglutathione lyase